ncbi:hypothetical protein CKAH01_04908 [Colletotrichum kahawae]|uniref:Uncharacterized protein n=1 Tax=Colletotrichum kahawae TaxID=34407 RepID=A0AAD9YI15_COLKA|nr:hypothetical protein CKAH01_04908 [Colletotrichum kahawae]
MKFSIIAVALPLIAGTTAAPSGAATIVERQSPNCAPYNNGTSAPFPNELVWGEWFLCCSYNGPDPGTYQNCCDRQGAGTGSGFPGCVKI